MHLLKNTFVFYFCLTRQFRQQSISLSSSLIWLFTVWNSKQVIGPYCDQWCLQGNMLGIAILIVFSRFVFGWRRSLKTKMLQTMFDAVKNWWLFTSEYSTAYKIELVQCVQLLSPGVSRTQTSDPES